MQSPIIPSDDDETRVAILNASILIVDDQAAHVHLLDRLLRDAGYVNVRSTLDPREVGALHAERHHDLILLDLQMPGLDGFGVMEELRADLGTPCLPVIVLTAQPMHKLRALQAGARDFINKPFDAVEVQLRIHHMLEVRLLQKKLEAHNHELERRVRERTVELQESEARYRSLTELAVDWYWEQDDSGRFTMVTGPVLELLGMTQVAVADPAGALDAGAAVAPGVVAPEAVAGIEPAEAAGAAAGCGGQADISLCQVCEGAGNWDAAERQTLTDLIQARRPFLDLVMHRRPPDGVSQMFRISGQPMLDRHCRFIGYRGLGVEVRGV